MVTLKWFCRNAFIFKYPSSLLKKNYKKIQLHCLITSHTKAGGPLESERWDVDEYPCSVMFFRQIPREKVFHETSSFTLGQQAQLRLPRFQAETRGEPSCWAGFSRRRVCPWWAARHGKVKVPILLPELSDLLLHVFRELPRKKSKGNENAEIRSADCCDYWLQYHIACPAVSSKKWGCLIIRFTRLFIYFSISLNLVVF